MKPGGIQQGPTDGNPQVNSLVFTVNLPEILPVSPRIVKGSETVLLWGRLGICAQPTGTECAQM